MDTSLSKVYHFVTKEDILNKIENFSNQIALNFSKTMRLIISTTMPLLDYYTIFEQESSEFGYNKFGAEVDVRFYLDPNVYRKLKNTHGVMHTFSVAVLVRKMIELFFILVEAKGLDWVIKSMKSGIKKIINILVKTRCLYKNTENMVHMYGEMLMEEHITMIFSKNASFTNIKQFFILDLSKLNMIDSIYKNFIYYLGKNNDTF